MILQATSVWGLAGLCGGDGEGGDIDHRPGKLGRLGPVFKEVNIRSRSRRGSR